MSRQKTITVYSFAELSAISQQRAISDYEESGIHEYWDEPIIEGIKEEAYEIGILDFDVLYSGFCSQGDGLSFTGSLTDLLVETIYKENINRNGFSFGEQLFVEFKRKSYPHYVHENMVYCDVSQNAIFQENESEENSGFEHSGVLESTKILEGVFNEWKNDLCSSWYNRLESHYFEMFSRDNLVLELSKYEFYEDGKCAGLRPEPSLPYKEYNIASLKINDESSNRPLDVEINVSTTKKVIIHIDNICTLRLNRESADQLALSIKSAESIASQIGVIPLNQLI